VTEREKGKRCKERETERERGRERDEEERERKGGFQVDRCKGKDNREGERECV